jgi:hypothetical protein
MASAIMRAAPRAKAALFAVDTPQHRVDVHGGQYVGAGQDLCLSGQPDQGVAGDGLQIAGQYGG